MKEHLSPRDLACAPDPAVYEPFIGPEEAGRFLDCTPRYVMRLARDGEIPAHPLRRGRRQQWRFLRSELAAHLTGRPVRATVRNGSLLRAA